MENSGSTVAINDLLVSRHGHGQAAALRVLPAGWPAGVPVRCVAPTRCLTFEALRVYWLSRTCLLFLIQIFKMVTCIRQLERLIVLKTFCFLSRPIVFLAFAQRVPFS